MLPWGSLLAAVARPDPTLLANMRALSEPGGRLTVVLGPDPVRDRAELQRLGLELPEDAVGWLVRLADAYASAGWRLLEARSLGRDEIERWPSSWARRLVHGTPRRFVELHAQAEART